jgi:CheY-like chemotaxis protein
MTSGPQSARPRNVLPVKDNPVNQRITVRLLVRRGHRVTLANLEALGSPADFSGLDANLVTRVAEAKRLAAALRQFQAGT